MARSSEGSRASVTRFKVYLRGPVTLIYTCCQMFGSGTVTTCFNDLGLLMRDLNPACTNIGQLPV